MILLFADCRAAIKLAGEDSADVSAGSTLDPPVPSDPISALDRPAGERLLASVGTPAIPALMSFAKALIPCWVPVARAPAIVMGLTGGITPNGVGTFGGSGDQPWVVLP